MIGVLVFPKFQLLDAAGPISAFEIAGRLAGVRSSIKVIAADAGEVASSSGVTLLARGLKSPAGLTTLIIVGGEGVRAAAAHPRVLSFVRNAARRRCRVASVCSGT